MSKAIFTASSKAQQAVDYLKSFQAKELEKADGHTKKLSGVFAGERRKTTSPKGRKSYLIQSADLDKSAT